MSVRNFFLVGLLLPALAMSVACSGGDRPVVRIVDPPDQHLTVGYATLTLHTVVEGDDVELLGFVDGQPAGKKVDVSCGWGECDEQLRLPVAALPNGEHEFEVRALSEWGEASDSISLDLRDGVFVDALMVENEPDDGSRCRPRAARESTRIRRTGCAQRRGCAPRPRARLPKGRKLD